MKISITDKTMSLLIKVLHNIPRKGNEKNPHQTENSNENNQDKYSQENPENKTGAHKKKKSKKIQKKLELVSDFSTSTGTAKRHTYFTKAKIIA